MAHISLEHDISRKHLLNPLKAFSSLQAVSRGERV